MGRSAALSGRPCGGANFYVMVSVVIFDWPRRAWRRVAWRCISVAMHTSFPGRVIFFDQDALLVTEGLPPTAERLAGSAGICSLPPDSFRGAWP